MRQILKSLVLPLLIVCVSVIFNAVVGAGIAYLVGITPIYGAIALVLISLVSMPFLPRGVARAGTNTEVWTGEVLLALRELLEHMGWYSRIRSYDEEVRNDTIHFTEIGAEPEVLVNNTTYPLGITSVEDADKPIALDIFVTKPSGIPDAELDSVCYDKLGKVRAIHKEVVAEKIVVKAAHALTPQSHTDSTPVLLTSGEVNVAERRKKLSIADLLALKKIADKWHIPQGERVLVLCPDHVQDLLSVSESFERQYGLNNQEGKITRLYGFDIYEYTATPFYTVATKTKLAFGAIPGAGTQQSSFFFHDKSAMRASGSLSTYERRAETDPENQRSIYNVRQRAIASLLRKGKCSAAIISAAA